ncbi:hypothetical protein M3Y96_01014400 [Aphelenchoides besseyi]|nr:hypothetical protein M3Y96_01014400 [Aphelenchoides besseyi]
MNLVNILSVLLIITVGNVSAKMSDYACIKNGSRDTYNDITFWQCKTAELTVEWTKPYSLLMEVFAKVNQTAQFKLQVENCVLSFQSQPSGNSTWNWKLDSYAKVFESPFTLEVTNSNQLLELYSQVNVGCRGQKTRTDDGDGKLWMIVKIDTSETVGEVNMKLSARELAESPHSKPAIEEEESGN